MNNRSLLRLALCVCLAVLPLGASAQTYPDRSVRMIVAFPAGGTLDTLARIVSQKLSEEWGPSVVVENRPGAGGNIGAAAAAQAAPDGYTLHFGAQSLAVNVTIAPQKGLDPVKDFEPIVLVATGQDVMMVPPDSPAKTVADFIAIAKEHPGELNYATLGPGTSAHLATVLFSNLAGIKMQQVPYTGVSQAATDLISGRVDVFIPTLGGHLGNIKAGRVRALAVSGPVRSEELPDVPTFKELGVPFVEESSWYGVYAPKGTPAEVIAKVNRDVGRVLQSAEMKERSRTLGFRLIGGPPERLAEMLKNEIAKWAEVAKSAGLVTP
jgi:tripartite-type tricarboxylate transporter receptor subunit TctC